MVLRQVQISCLLSDGSRSEGIEGDPPDFMSPLRLMKTKDKRILTLFLEDALCEPQYQLGPDGNPPPHLLVMHSSTGVRSHVL